MASQPKTVGERVGGLAAECIDLIEARYGKDAGVGAVAIVVDVIAGDEQAVNPIVTASNDPRRWVQVALLREATEEAEIMNQLRVEEAEDAG